MQIYNSTDINEYKVLSFSVYFEVSMIVVIYGCSTSNMHIMLN